MFRNQRRAFATPNTQDWKDEKEWKASKWEQWKPKASSSKSEMLRVFLTFGLFVLVCFSALKSSIWKKHSLSYFGPEIAAGEKSVLFIRVEHFPWGNSSGENDPWSSDDPWSSWKKSKWPEEQQNQTTLGHTRFTGIWQIYHISFGAACCRASDEQNEPSSISMSLYMFHGKLVQLMATKAVCFDMLQREFDGIRTASIHSGFFKAISQSQSSASSSKLKCNWNTLHLYGGFEHT